MSDAEEREAVVAEAMSWMLTPYHEHARLKGIGVDCAQFLIAVYTAALQLEEPAVSAYAIDWFLHSNEEKYLEGIAPYAIPIATEDAAPGDIALFRFGRAIAHAAIITAWPMMIHADRATGRVALESLEEGQPYRARLSGIYSLQRWRTFQLHSALFGSETPQ